MEEIELGDKVKDVITGYEGIAVARVQFINGCIQYTIAKVLKKGEKPAIEGEPSIDVMSLIVVEKDYFNKMKKPKEKVKHTGGATKYLNGMRGY